MPERFVSYAQNFEDVMLWRALKDVDQGFYVDVGAYSPVEHSVTEAFYQRGWHGVNVEPHAGYHKEFMIARPLDINLMVAAGDQASDRTLYLIDETGLSTLDEAQAEERRREGRSVVETTVRVESLAAIWNMHIGPRQPVHFLKIDVEGFERQVIAGNDWATNRPWIVVVESTLPLTMSPSHESWESLLTGSGYEYVYADGLNRFYVASEHRDMSPAFAHPPNVFDDFVLVGESRQAERAVAAEARAIAAEARAVRAEGELGTIRSSRSWRITAPLRVIVAASRTARDRARRLSPFAQRATSPSTAEGAVRSLDWHSALRRSKKLLKKVPGVVSLHRRLTSGSTTRDISRNELADLSPRAQHIYEMLSAPRDTKNSG